MAQALREARSDSVPPAVRPLPLGRAYVALQDLLPEPDLRLDAYRPAPVALIADDGGPIATALTAALREAGWQIRILALPGVEAHREAEVCRTLADWSEAALAEAMSALVGEEGALDLGLIALTEVDTPAAAAERLTHALLTAKHLQDPLAKIASRGTRAALVSVTALDGALGYRGSHGRTGGALVGGVGGLLRTFALETEGVFCRALDYAPELPAEVVAARILREISDASAAAYEVGDDGTTRSAPVLSDTPALLPIPALGGAAPAVEPDDLFVVTGGARGITAWCVLEMAREYQCAFLLLGRTPLTGRPGASDAEDEIQSTLESLRALGVQAEYLAADVADAAAVADALRPHADRVTGVIHGAGVLADEWLKRKTAETVARVVGPKLTGLAAVLDAVDADRLRHLVVFSSVAGLNGNLRQSDYAMVNEALNRFACAWRHGHPGCRVSAVPFGPWEGGMANAAIRKLFEQQGVPMLTRELGTRLFTEQLGPDHADHVVTVLGPTKPLYRRTGSLPFGGVRAVRDLTGLAEHPVLRDHAPNGRTPVLPMSAAIGWCGSYLQGLYIDKSMVEVQGFRMVKGVLFDGSERDRFLAEATSAPDIGAGWARVSINSRSGAGPAVLRCEGRFRMAAEPEPAPVLDGLDGCEVRPFEPHPQYAQGLLFHGPSLIGLGPELLVEPHRVVAMAKLADARLPGFSTRWYDGILADLLPQATQLLERRLSGHRSLPTGVESVEIFARIPADLPFLIVVDLAERRAFDTRYDVSACDMDGRVLLRWRGLSMLTITPEVAAGFEWIPADRKAAGSA
jgi:NAD(P)-dependent dehydrogenase (short-subunit alcohol dehydrogenase family)